MPKTTPRRLELGAYAIEDDGQSLSITESGAPAEPSRHLIRLLFDEILAIGQDLDELRPVYAKERARASDLTKHWQMAERAHAERERLWQLDKVRADSLAIELDRMRSNCEDDATETVFGELKPSDSTNHLDPTSSGLLPRELRES